MVMKINPNYKLREIAGETIVMKQGKAGSDFTRILSLNSSARLLYERLYGKDFTVEDAAAVLTEEYGIDQERALKDADSWADNLMNLGVLEK